MIENPRGRNWSPEQDKQDDLKRIAFMPDVHYAHSVDGSDYVVVWPRTGEAARWIDSNTMRHSYQSKLAAINAGEPVTMTLNTFVLMESEGFRVRVAPDRLVRRWRGS